MVIRIVPSDLRGLVKNNGNTGVSALCQNDLLENKAGVIAGKSSPLRCIA